DGKAYSVYEFDALPDNERVGCELRYYYLPHSHELYVGTTGSGKTTGCVEPQLRAISSQKNKPHLFLTDPKGELFNRNARHLQDQGYKLFVLNFKDLRRTDKWNPLLEVYDKKMKLKNLGNDCIMRTGLVSSDLSIFGNKEDFSPSGYIEYRGYAFANGTACDNYIHFEEDYIEAEVDNLVNQLANMMIDVQSSKDKSWEFGAQDLLKGLIHCMLEDALDEDSGFTRDMMTFRTLQQYYLALRTPIMGEDCSLNNHWLLEDKSAKTKALMATALDNAPNTMRSYCGVFDGAVKDWFQGHIFALTTDSTVNLEGIGDHPFAIFLITRDYEKSDFLIAGLFIDWVYRQMLERAEQSKSITRTLHFLLDEFGNIPAIKDMENKIATSRSRNIWFHLFVQSYKQIDFTYNAECSTIIRDNCNAQIFLGAQNIETKAIFSRECGKHYIPTLESKLSTSNNSIHEVPLIPVSHLDQIKSGQMYTKRLNMPVIMSQFIRSYICARQGTYKHFADANGLETCTPNKIEAYTSARFTYAKLAKKRDK
ncbi:MAG: type IV secretory system conjugative DNA transfer family protein, partial [Clostridia bacterium]